MFGQKPAREAPIKLKYKGPDPARPAVPEEPVLAIDKIQGNLIGFNKDYQTFLFLRVIDLEPFRAWLGRLIPFIATAAEVLQFNQLFKAIRRRRGVETQTVQATWINIVLSFKLLQGLAADAAALKERAKRFDDYKDPQLGVDKFGADKFCDEAFMKGMLANAFEKLGDPQSNQAEGNPERWVFGGPGNEADALIIVGSDSSQGLHTEVARIEESLYSGRTSAGECARSGAQVLYKQQGAVLPPPLSGHEHFGFLDGVSQPGLRGRLSEDPTDVLTLRQNPNDLNQGKPGQSLLWPGEFVFGYPRQNLSPQENQEHSKGPDALDCPVWAKDGSFVVVRRLRQDVEAFRRFLDTWSKKLTDRLGYLVTPDYIAARLVGRWPSGAPLMRQEQADDPELGFDDCANNNFQYRAASEPINASEAEGSICAGDNFSPSRGGSDGLVCPFAAHIRKTNPRDDTSETQADLSEAEVKRHRMLRRGIPFGDPYYLRVEKQGKDIGNRGLMFVAYMTSISNQFEFVAWRWANNAQFKKDMDGYEFQEGHDLIIGQNNSPDGERTRHFALQMKDSGGVSTRMILHTDEEWVIPTGGGYFFSPSIEALRLLTDAD